MPIVFNLSVYTKNPFVISRLTLLYLFVDDLSYFDSINHAVLPMSYVWLAILTMYTVNLHHNILYAPANINCTM
jgi:hypothetical protein